MNFRVFGFKHTALGSLILTLAALGSVAAAEGLIEKPSYVVHCENNATYPIHLTFDDGPVVGRTDVILDTLKRHHISATFFMTTERLAFVLKKKDPSQYSKGEQAYLDLISRILQEGHKIGNHSFQHINHLGLQKYTEAEIFANIEKSAEIWERLKLPKPAPFRFPFGGGWSALTKMPTTAAEKESERRTLEFQTRLHSRLKEAGFYLEHWDIDSWDWSKDKRQDALSYALQAQVCSHQGGIILMHDLQKFTVATLEHTIELLLAAGHEFVSDDWMTANQPGRYAFRSQVVSTRYCNRPEGDFDQVWSSCQEYNEKSSDVNREKMRLERRSEASGDSPMKVSSNVLDLF